MSHKKSSNDGTIKKSNFGTTELWAAIVGLATGLVTGWLQLRKEFYEALKKTAIYDAAIEKRKPYKNLTEDTPEFFEKYHEIGIAYRREVHRIHEKHGLTGFKGTVRKFRLLSKSDKLELVEKMGAFAFMGGAVIVGLGVLLDTTLSHKLRSDLEGKNPDEGKSV